MAASPCQGREGILDRDKILSAALLTILGVGWVPMMDDSHHLKSTSERQGQTGAPLPLGNKGARLEHSSLCANQPSGQPGRK